jgi:cytochrome c553
VPFAAKGRWALLAALFISAAHGQTDDRLAAQLHACAGCHGTDGNSTIAGTPSIAEQPRIFIENYLVMTREGIRGSAVMQGLLKGMPDKEIIALAKHYSGLKAKAAGGPIDRKLYQRGKAIAAGNRCSSCHDSTFRGKDQMPRLAGQREEFLAVMLQYRQNRRPGGDTIMNASLQGIAKRTSRPGALLRGGSRAC